MHSEEAPFLVVSSLLSPVTFLSEELCCLDPFSQDPSLGSNPSLEVFLILPLLII